MKIFLNTVKPRGLKVLRFFSLNLLLSVAVTVCGVITNHFTGKLSQAALDFNTRALVSLLAVMAVVAVANALSEAARALLSGRFLGKTDFNLREHFAKHFTRVKYNHLSSGQASGGLLSVFTADLPRAVAYVAQSVPNMASEVLSVVIILVYMAVIQPFYTLLFFLMFPVLIFMQAKLAAPIQTKAMARSAARQKFNAVVNDSLQNIPTVVAYSLEQTMEDRYLSAYGQFYQASKSYIRSFISLIMAGMVASILPIVFIYAVSGLAVVNGNMTVSEFVAYTSVSSFATSWILGLSQQLNNFSVNAAGAEKLNETEAGEEENISNIAPSFVAINEAEPAVEFSGVSFGYNNEVKVLHNVSFTVKKGERVAVVGESGSGKSTLLKLLLALYEPSEGRISVSGTDIHSVAADVLRAGVAYVPQDSFMFPETIAQNLPHTSMEKLRQACESAGILTFIESLPEGFNTVLSEAAENISGGQRQRLAIARAYLQNAPIVLFDEATASLDPATEADVLKSFVKMAEGRTVIMVAHRAAAIEACDRVIMMEKGRVIAQGTHAELMRDESHV